MKIVLGIIVAAVLVVAADSVFILNQTEQAIVLQFGEPIREIKTPGLKFKLPFIQKVVFYDNRLLNLDPPAQEVVLNDKKMIKSAWMSTTLPVIALLTRSNFIRPSALRLRLVPNWKKSSIRRYARFWGA